MEFTLPTTKSEMYDRLKDIFNFYRLPYIDYQEVYMDELSLERMEFTVLTDEELTEKAETLLKPSQTERKMKYIQDLSEKVGELTAEKQGLDDKYDELIKKAITTFEKAKETLKKTALKSGTGPSVIFADKINTLEKNKNEKVAELSAQKTEKESILESEIQEKQALIDGADTYYSDLVSAEIQAKYHELKDEQDKIMREVFEFNSKAEENELKYNNSLIKFNANLRAKYAELSCDELTKEQLVERGYYADVLRCVSAYYDTLSSADAYSDIRYEKDLIPYIDDYYTDVVYMYKVRAEN